MKTIQGDETKAMTKRKLAEWIVNARYALLAATVVCAVLAALSIGRTKINYDLTRYLSDSTMTKQALQVMDDEFGASEQLRVMFVNPSEEALAEYAAAIGQLPDVLAVSPSDQAVTDGDGNALRLI